MRYCTLADLLLAIPAQTLIQLTHDVTTDYGQTMPSEPNGVVIEEAVRQAEDLVDAFLRGRYDLPLSPVPTVIKDVSVNLARHWLYARRPEGNELPDAVTRTYKASMHILEQIRENRLTIGDPAGRPAAEASEMKVRAKPRMFDRDQLDRY